MSLLSFRHKRTRIDEEAILSDCCSFFPCQFCVVDKVVFLVVVLHLSTAALLRFVFALLLLFHAAHLNVAIVVGFGVIDRDIVTGSRFQTIGGSGDLQEALTVCCGARINRVLAVLLQNLLSDVDCVVSSRIERDVDVNVHSMAFVVLSDGRWSTKEVTAREKTTSSSCRW